jgi:subtilisin-like proprotein convertase family protein
MQPNFTYQKKKSSIMLSSLFSLLFALLSFVTFAQPYSNGPLSTGATSSNGTSAPTGFTWSEVQAGNGTAGYTASISAGFSVADNFSVIGSWNVTKITFYAYSSGYAGTTSPFDAVTVAIFNTDPSVGNPTPIFGDRTTNRFLASSTASMYRIFNATPGTTRQIFKIEASVPVTLTTGNYWVEWKVGTALASNFSPPVTIVGAVSPSGANAKQRSAAGAWTALLDGTNAQEMPFLIDYTTSACAGTPTPGNTVSSVTSVCPGINFNLSLQNSTPGSGVTYQWQSSADGTNWTSVSGATNPTLSTNLTSSTYYRCIVSCSGNPGTSTPVLVSLAPNSSCYCVAGATSTAFEKISNVTFGTINNNSTSTAGYENFLTQSTNVIAGQTLPISVSLSGGFSSDVVRVWIDFNQDGDFTDAGEAVYVSAQGVGPHVGNITIPGSATIGSTRMRVRMYDASFGANTTPCGNSTYGQVEDYTVNIQPCVQNAFTTQPANTTITCGANATFTVAASGSAPAFTWQFRTSPTAAWQTLLNGGVVSGATTSTLTFTNVPTTWSGYEIRSILSGPCTGVTPSNSATFTVNPVQTNVSPASAVICRGGLQRLTITNFASTSAPMTATFTSTDVPKAIPDASAAGTSSNITVSGLPAGATITNLAVKFSIPAHTWPGDVAIALRTPNGQVLNLDYYITGTGYGPGSGMVNTIISSLGTAALSSATSPFTGTFRADRAGNADASTSGMPVTTTSWAALYGPATGTYTLALRDSYAGDVGTLTAWSVDVTYVIPSYGQGVWTATPAEAGTMFLDAAGLVPYTGTLEDTIFVRPNVNTTYSVFFNSTISPCTSAPAQVPVTVGLPINNLSVPASVATCVGSGFTITATHDAIPATNAAPIYQWQQSADGGVTWTSIANATTPVLAVSSTTQAMNGMRYRILSQSGSCAIAASGSTTLVVNARPSITLASPTVNLTPGKTTTITGSSSPAAATWSWSLNGATIGGTGNTQVVNIDGLGNYQATVRDVNGCVNSSNILSIGAEASDKLWIYPNPTAGAFQVRYYHAGDMNEKRIISVFNAAGQLVASKSFDLTYTSSPYLRMDVDLSGAARGTYVVKVAHEFSGKIVSGLVLVQ